MESVDRNIWDGTTEGKLKTWKLGLDCLEIALIPQPFVSISWLFRDFEPTLMNQWQRRHFALTAQPNAAKLVSSIYWSQMHKDAGLLRCCWHV